MDEKETATETIAETIAPQETTLEPEQDYEAQIVKLEDEKENYRKAYLKEASKNKDPDANESEDDRIRRIAREVAADTRIAEIDKEKDALFAKTLKENKELKLAQMNKTGAPPAAVGTHAEGQPVRDTLVTPEQLAHFKSKGWSDQDIERYKKNLQRGGGR